MLFSDFLPQGEKPEPERFALIDKMLVDFSEAFPDLHFELRLDRKVINAQAILLRGRRCVLIYGGIALHPKLGEQSLTFVFLHEAGHHLGVGPRLLFDPSLACDCVADSWAAQEGAEILFQITGRRLQIEMAVSELDLLMPAERDHQLLPVEMRASSCWNGKWAQRRTALKAKSVLALSSRRLCEST
jgi:hypothetical protein